MGLAAVALANSKPSIRPSEFMERLDTYYRTDPEFPYPGGLSQAQTDAGLTAPASAVILLGKGGAAAMVGSNVLRASDMRYTKTDLPS